MSTKSKRLGWIGLGRFGRFAVAHLTDHFEVLVHDRADRGEAIRSIGARQVPLEEVAACPYVVVAVPLPAFGDVLAEIAPLLSPGTLVLDVGSVKQLPVQQMTELLPEEVEIIGTHPLFGPQSAAAGLEGHAIALCPGRTSRADRVRAFLEERLGLDVVTTDPETHDREIARTQGLAQFLGRALATLEESDSPVRTPAYDRLREVARTVGDDTEELFVAIQTLNPHAGAVRRRILDALVRLDGALERSTEPTSPGDD